MHLRIQLALLLPVIMLMTPNTFSAEPKRPAWSGKIQQWGTLREVMHGTTMEGQVRLSKVMDTPHVYGIGAPAKLRGEIVIADGEAWIAEIRDSDRIDTRQTDGSDDSAVFLAVAQVPSWLEVRVNRDVAADEFDDFLRETLRSAGLEDSDTVPFVVEGRFPSLDLHVLNGQCPFAEEKSKVEGAGPPHRKSYKHAAGLLVGFYSEHGAGRITHHWTRTHVHALLETEANDRAVGHVDAVTLKSGTIVRLPNRAATSK